MNLYLERRFEAEISRLFHYLLQFLAREEYECEADLYVKLADAHVAAIATVRSELTLLVPPSTNKDDLLPLCRRTWRAIQQPIVEGRGRMIDVLLSHGIFVTVDLQPGFGENFVDDFRNMGPNINVDLLSIRFERIASAIDSAMQSREDVFDANTYARVDNLLTQLQPAIVGTHIFGTGAANSFLCCRPIDRFVRLRKVSAKKLADICWCFDHFI